MNVKHPFIVELKYAFQDDKNLYFILTLATGGDFQFHLRSIGRFPEEWIRFYAAELILVLEYLHSKNILYRDLKPENILLESSGHIKVVDLGLCSYFEPGEQLESRCGTKSYMSPEQACGKYSTATDWWSLGVTILTLLMGKNPFFRKSKKKEEKSLLTGIKSLGLSISAQLKKRNSSGVGSSGKYIKGIPESLDFARSFPLEFNNVELVNKEDRMHRSSKSKELIEGEENALSEEQNPILSPLKINDMKDLDEEFQAISPLLDPQESAFSPQQKKAELLHYYQEVIDRITLPPDSSKQIEDLILGLVCVDPDSRLGRNGAQELKSHPFFAEINWELLKLKCVSPPFIPDPCSVNAVYIEDTKFVNTKSRGSRQYFEGFDYTSPIAFQEEILESVHDENDLLQFRTH